MSDTSEDTGPGPGETEVELTIDEALAHAIKIHKDGYVKAAVKIYAAILSSQGNNVDALHFMGVAAMQLGNPEEAEALIRAALSHDPNHPDAHNNLGNVLQGQGKLDEAVVAYRRANELRPNNPDTLSNVAAIYAARKNYEMAIEGYRQVLAMAPDHVETYHNLGAALVASGDLEAGLAAFQEALKRKPYNPEAYRRLGTALAAVKRFEDAAEMFKLWCEYAPDDEEAKHMLAAVSGGPPPERASDAMVKQLFDRFSTSFDLVLHRLEYKAPAIVGETLAQLMGEPRAQLAMLDAGCGTGLGGPLLKPYARHLTGLDLSPGMIEKAKSRGLYDEFVVGELAGYMAANPSKFDVVTAIDTFCYIGDLSNTLKALRETLVPGGHGIFTVERSADADAPNGSVLHTHGRYSHSGDYLVKALSSAGLELVVRREEVLRMEGGKPVDGFAIVARRPLSS